MRKKDDLDLLLDSALASYADPGPNSSLEGRILESVAASASAVGPRPVFSPGRRWRPWVIAIPIAASLVFMALSLSNHRHAPKLGTEQARQSHSKPAVGPSASLEAHHPPIRRSAPRPERGGKKLAPQLASAAAPEPEPPPKLNVFPTPQPLTAQERALVVCTEAPLPVRKALAVALNDEDAPVRIAEIQIPPLEHPDQSQP